MKRRGFLSSLLFGSVAIASAPLLKAEGKPFTTLVKAKPEELGGFIPGSHKEMSTLLSEIRVRNSNNAIEQLLLHAEALDGKTHKVHWVAHGF